MREMDSSTGEALAQAIWETHSSFEIVDKIVSTTTDNGRNFVSINLDLFLLDYF